MNTLIWYDGIRKRYFSGSMLDLEQQIKNSEIKSNFQVIYEFDRTKDHQVPRILESLNAARYQDQRSES